MTVYILTMIGVAVYAASGALEAGRKKFDLMGVVVLAMVTALGGGTIRDILIGLYPVFWIADPAYLLTVLCATGVTLVYVRRWRPPYTALLVADALGLALFTISGVQVAETQGLPALAIVALGTTTGAAGGVVRDVLAGEVPLLFRPTETLYATASIIGASSYLLLQHLGAGRIPAILSGMGVIAALRFAAIFWHLRLPAFELPHEA